MQGKFSQSSFSIYDEMLTLVSCDLGAGQGRKQRVSSEEQWRALARPCEEGGRCTYMGKRLSGNLICCLVRLLWNDLHLCSELAGGMRRWLSELRELK